MSPQLQLLPPVPPPVGLFVRPGWNDHVILQRLLLEGHAPTGFVFEARLEARQRELVDAAIDANVDAILETNLQELWSGGARELSGIPTLPWATFADADVRTRLRSIARSLVDHISIRGYTSILAPTHYLRDMQDPSLREDVRLAAQLRDELERRHMRNIRIYFPLAAPATALSANADRERLLHELSSLDIDALWLRLHPFGTSTAGPLALRRYVEACLHLQRLGVPIVAERTGTVGIALLSLNAVGGIECGVTLGEKFDARRLLSVRDPDKSGYSHPAMVYLNALSAFVSKAVARELAARRSTKAALGCRDSQCCPHGPDDMIWNARRHGFLRRLGEVEVVGQTPPHRRREVYLAHLREAGDLAVRLAAAHPSLTNARNRLDSWRGTISGLPAQDRIDAAPPPALGHRLHTAPRPIALPNEP